MSDKFIEEHKDFILKITLEGSNEDDNQIRRVKLSRILDYKGKVSFEDLIGLTIQLSFPAKDDAVLSSWLSQKKKNYKVTLTYYDVDSDLIYLGSTEELLDAIEQYSSKQRFMRMYAKVERRQTSQQQRQQMQQKEVCVTKNTGTHSVTNASSSAIAAVPVPLSSSTQQLKKKSNNDIADSPNQKINQIQKNVVGSIITSLETASVAIHGPSSSLSSTIPNQPITKITPEKEVKAVVKSDSKDNETRANGNSFVVRGDHKQLPLNIEVEQNTNVNSTRNNTSKNNNKKDLDIKKLKICNRNKNEQEKPSFIHGRFTCDQCFLTPIVGNRYHATNLPDHDLCEKCHRTYNGNEIQFKIVELETDRRQQPYWRIRTKLDIGKQTRASLNHVKRVAVSGNQKYSTIVDSNIYNNISIKTSDTNKDGSNVKDEEYSIDTKEQVKPVFIHGRHTCNSCFITPIVGNRYRATNLHDHDLCKKCHDSNKENDIQFEIVELDCDHLYQKRWQRQCKRRTLHQNREHRSVDGFCSSFGTGSPRQCGEPPQSLRTRTKQVVGSKLKECIRRSLEDVNMDRTVEEKGNTTKNRDVLGKPGIFLESSDGLVGEKKDDHPVYTKTKEPSAPLKAGSHRAATEATTIAHNEKKGKEKKEADGKTSTIGEKQYALSEENSVLSQEESSTRSHLRIPHEEVCAEKEISFAADADGNGSVAEIIGETLDKSAKDIDEIVMEIHLHDSTDKKRKETEPNEDTFFDASKEFNDSSSIEDRQEDDDASNTDKNTPVGDHGVEEVAESYRIFFCSAKKSPHGDKIDIQAEEASKGDDNVVSEWQLVNKNRDNTTVDEDAEALAFATQLIGSTLFDR